jgi:prepilin-type N-terminal cleavage/methylation domain-containing protein
MFCDGDGNDSHESVLEERKCKPVLIPSGYFLHDALWRREGCFFRIRVPLPMKASWIAIGGMSRMRPRTVAANGFTLVELMVTVGLLAFLGIVAASSFDSRSWLAHYRLKAAVRNLEMNFHYARMEAIKRNTYCTITFRQLLDGETYDYVIYSDLDKDLKYDSGEEILRRVKLSDYTNVWFDASQGDGGLTFTQVEGHPSIAFDSRGLPRSASGFGAGSAYLQNDCGNQLKMVLNSTGRIRIDPY